MAGHGREHVAAKLGVTLQTIRNWRKKYPAFNHAMTVGLLTSKTALIDNALRNIVSAGGCVYNTPLFNRILQTVYRDDESAAVEIDGWEDAKDTHARLDLIERELGNGNLTPEQAERFTNVLTKKLNAVEYGQQLQAIQDKLAAIEQAQGASNG